MVESYRSYRKLFVAERKADRLFIAPFVISADKLLTALTVIELKR